MADVNAFDCVKIDWSPVNQIEVLKGDKTAYIDRLLLGKGSWIVFQSDTGVKLKRQRLGYL